MDEIGYIVRGNLIEKTELLVKPGITVFAGLNATFKSIAARTFLIHGIDDKKGLEEFFPTFIDLKEDGVEIEFISEHESIVKNARKLLIPDYRLFIRSFLIIKENFMAMFKIINKCIFDAERIGWHQCCDCIEDTNSLLLDVLSKTALKFFKDYASTKSQASIDIVAKLWKELDNVLKQIVKKFPMEFSNIDIARKSIMPIRIVKLIVDDYGFPSDLSIEDTRFSKEIRIGTISTSVIAPILFEFVTAYLSSGGDKILVIEEPEESMTPIQQVVFAKYLEAIVKKSMKMTRTRTYVIVTTHSPYIAYAFSKEVPIKYFGFSENKILVEDKPMKSFALGDLALP